VAIKMLSERWAGSDQARQRLINEAKAAAALEHPNICSIYEVGEEDGRVFIVMPFIDGQSLAERIRKRALPPGDVVDIGIQMRNRHIRIRTRNAPRSVASRRD
jgi:eukaryotic-like serine/threonine-protein kinase